MIELVLIGRVLKQAKTKCTLRECVIDLTDPRLKRVKV